MMRLLFFFSALIIIGESMLAAPLQPEQIEGYWLVYNLHGQKDGITQLKIKNGTLQGYAVRLFPNSRKIEYLCNQCPQPYDRQPVWALAGPLIKNYISKDASLLHWYKGRIYEPRWKKILYPHIKFYDAFYGAIVSRVFFFTIKNKMEKITSAKAFENCQIIVDSAFRARYALQTQHGRRKLLQDYNLTQHDLMDKINHGHFCARYD